MASRIPAGIQRNKTVNFDGQVCRRTLTSIYQTTLISVAFFREITC